MAGWPNKRYAIFCTAREHACCYCLQTFLASDELGDSLNGVEALIKKHEDFEKTLVAWEEKFKVSC